MSEISLFWDTEVRPLVEKCAVGYSQMVQAEHTANKAERDRIIDEMKAEHGERDYTSVWYIGQMAGRVEHNLADGRDPLVCILQSYGTLNSESFYSDVFGGKETEEVRNYRSLGKKLDEMLKMGRSS